MSTSPQGTPQGNEAPRNSSLSAKEIEQIQADRQRLGLTPAMLEQRRLESLRRPF